VDVAAANTRAARAVVRALAESGVRDACITPGSRSTPLTVAFAEQRAIRPWLHLDERSSAFFALGLARASNRPVALVCTSGTAAANFHPAVAEADLSRIPLLVLTTDRPPHLRGVGAAQTMDQAGLYSTSTRFALDLPLPGGSAADESRFAAFARRAVREALGALPGPVHLNFPFEEPLLGAPADHPSPPAGEVRVAAIERTPPAPNAADIEAAAALLSASRRPLIVAGPETGGLPADGIAALAAVLDAPIFADPLSGLRTGSHDRSRVLDSYDAVLRDARSATLTPDYIVRFGAIPTSKALNQFVARQRGAGHILCDLPGSWRDPDGMTTQAIPGDPALVARALVAALDDIRGSEEGWTRSWSGRDARAREVMQAHCASFAEPFEGRVFSELQRTLPEGAIIVAGSSMPVRDLDSFLVGDGKRLELVSNRGVNGIDGVTSTAVGAAAAGNAPVVLVIGDISFYHDLTGLWAAKRHGLALTVVLVNNDGGGIFHYLPQSAHESVFEEWFGTPPGLDFEHAVRLFGGRYTLAGDWATFRDVLGDGRSPGLNVIEVRTDRARNVAMHRHAWAAAAEAAWSSLPVTTA